LSRNGWYLRLTLLADLDLKTPLEQATGLPVELENAANSCAFSRDLVRRHAEGVRIW